jgi:hypothetical protein
MFTGIRPLASRMRSWISPRRVDQKFQQELSAHLEMLTYENIQRGMIPIEAKRAARIRLGGSHYIGQKISNLGDCSCPIRFCRSPVQESRLQITKRILDRVPNRRIVQARQVSMWPAGFFSIAARPCPSSFGVNR